MPSDALNIELSKQYAPITELLFILGLGKEGEKPQLHIGLLGREERM